MNAEQLRAEAVERIARVLFEQDAADACSDDPFEHWAPRYRRKAEPFVDALGDLLPSGMEQSVAYAVTDDWGDHMMCRYVTDWSEVA